ncbi:Protein of unknown function, partial [Cotesia congregata]
MVFQFLLQNIKNHLKSVGETDELYQNLVQGNLWRTKVIPSFEDKFVLPIVMFDDDYGTNNPISSHRANSKVGAIYVQIACIPPAIQSKVKNIFTFILFDPSLIKLLGYNTILQYVLDKLQYLETTGVNFVANCCCRFCKNFYDNLNNIYHERFCLLRTHESFDSDLKLNNVSKTGINETCIFNDLKNFHIIDNLRCDVMHDLLEGVCESTMSLITHKFIEK